MVHELIDKILWTHDTAMISFRWNRKIRINV